jgi:hypothetical protein
MFARRRTSEVSPRPTVVAVGAGSGGGLGGGDQTAGVGGRTPGLADAIAGAGVGVDGLPVAFAGNPGAAGWSRPWGAAGRDQTRGPGHRTEPRCSARANTSPPARPRVSRPTRRSWRGCDGSARGAGGGAPAGSLGRVPVALFAGGDQSSATIGGGRDQPGGVPGAVSGHRSTRQELVTTSGAVAADSEKRRAELDEERERSLRQVLGEERYEEYRLAQNPLYQQAKGVAAAAGVSGGSNRAPGRDLSVDRDRGSADPERRQSVAGRESGAARGDADRAAGFDEAIARR